MWQGLIGSILLYGAFLVHGRLGLAAFYQRRFYGLTLLDVAQLVLGLAISALLANHLADTRLALLLYGLPKRYARVLITFWVLVPLFGVLQVAVLTVAWSHGCIGIHNAFRLKRWYGRASRSLLVIAILIPVLALLGFVQGAREAARDMALASWRAVELSQERIGTPAEATSLFHIRDIFIFAYPYWLAQRGWRSEGRGYQPRYAVFFLSPAYAHQSHESRLVQLLCASGGTIQVRCRTPRNDGRHGSRGKVGGVREGRCFCC